MKPLVAACPPGLSANISGLTTTFWSGTENESKHAACPEWAHGPTLFPCHRCSPDQGLPGQIGLQPSLTINPQHPLECQYMTLNLLVSKRIPKTKVLCQVTTHASSSTSNSVRHQASAENFCQSSRLTWFFLHQFKLFFSRTIQLETKLIKN